MNWIMDFLRGRDLEVMDFLRRFTLVFNQNHWFWFSHLRLDCCMFADSWNSFWNNKIDWVTYSNITSSKVGETFSGIELMASPSSLLFPFLFLLLKKQQQGVAYCLDWPLVKLLSQLPQVRTTCYRPSLLSVQIIFPHNHFNLFR